MLRRVVPVRTSLDYQLYVRKRLSGGPGPMGVRGVHSVDGVERCAQWWD